MGAPLAFIKDAAVFDGEGCLEWPYARSDRGYGQLHVDGKKVYAHRYVLELTVGPPFPGADAAHAPLVCHNRACVNPRHLRWATRAENMADAKIDGTVRAG